MPSTYEMVRDVMFPLNLAAALLFVFVIEEWISEKLWGGDDDDDTPKPA